MNPLHRSAPDLDTTPLDGPSALPGALLLRLLDALDFGVLLIEPDARLRYTNRPAREALGADDVLRIDAGRLMLHGPQQQRALLRALGEAAQGASRMLCLGGGVPSTKLALTPWDASADGTPLMLGTLQTGERRHWPALHAFARERRLTEGETDVMHQLVLGDRPPQIAARRGSSEGTVRSQIKALLEKTGTHSMRELVVEALHLPPMPVNVSAAGTARRTGGSSGEAPTTRRADAAAAPANPSSPRPRTASRTQPAETRSTRTGARCVRGAIGLDRKALAAIAASPFAWPPAA
jgi:DNA-binding CsgD family transcriptional regulator